MRKTRLFVLALIFSVSAPAFASVESTTYFPEKTNIPGDSYFVSVVEPGTSGNANWLAIQPAGVVADGEKRGGWVTCKDTKDPNCDFTREYKDGIVGNVVLPRCESATQDHCVESVAFAVGEGPFVTASFVKNSLETSLMAPDPALNFPGGGANSLWRSENAPHEIGKDYVVSVRTGLGFWKKNLGFEFGTVDAVVTPYRPVSPAGFSGISDCTFKEADLCGVVQDFPTNVRVQLNFRVSNTLGGWFQGRMKDPVIEVSKFSEKSNRITVSAEPATVSRFNLVRAKDQFSLKEQGWFENQGSSYTPGGKLTGPFAGQREVFDFVEFHRKALNDTATGKNTYWSLRTTSAGGGSYCLADKTRVLGIVSTNALGYNGDAPSFTEGSLDYRVTGFHYLPDGKTESLGTYDLVMRSDVARCLYKFSTAPISASVSITGGSEAKIATTVVNERNGWLKLAAYGFTFSEKTLQVKLSQETPAEVKPEPVVAAKPVAKKITISCVKGKTTKKVTAIKPKCPTGFKKKG
jgi:hypothetical protein